MNLSQHGLTVNSIVSELGRIQQGLATMSGHSLVSLISAIERLTSAIAELSSKLSVSDAVSFADHATPASNHHERTTNLADTYADAVSRDKFSRNRNAIKGSGPIETKSDLPSQRQSTRSRKIAVIPHY